MIIFYPSKLHVIVHTKSGKSFRGFLFKHNSQYLEMREVELLQSKELILPLDGAVILYHSDVEFLQIL